MKRNEMQTRYLIIGNSIAGVSCIEGIREVDPKGKTLVVSDESILNYSRPLISYYLGGKVSCDNLSFREESFYRNNRIELLLDIRAERLDWKKREVWLNNGKRVSYHKLLIATGGTPIIPPLSGMEKVKEGIFTFTKISDTMKLLDYIEASQVKEAVVLGAGLIGLKCTEGLVEKGIRVTIIELADRILANTLDKEASQILEEALKKQGCSVIKGDTIEAIDSSRKRLRSLTLKRGGKLPTKLLVLAIGVKPDTDIVRDTPIKCDRGILVNRLMETNVQDVYAAGDVAQGWDFLSHRNSVLALWPVAAHQGKIAGLNMAGQRVEYNGLFPMNSLELAGIPTISFGLTNPPMEDGNEILVWRDKEKNCYKKVVLKKNRIVGAIFLGKIERAGIFLGLIRDRIDVSSFKQHLLTDDFGLLILPKEYRKHLVTGEGIEV